MRGRLLASGLAFGLAGCAGDTPVLDPSAASPSITASGTAEGGAVYVASNAASGNTILVFPRSPSGQIGSPTGVPTGGLGSGGGLGNQGGLATASGGHLLYVVNAGSDEITGFLVRPEGLDHIGTWASGGDLPISVATHGRLLYVLHDGNEPGVHGFRIGAGGVLSPIHGSARGLSGAETPDAAQLGFSPDGRRLVVTEKATNLLTSFDVLPGGLLSGATTTPSAGATPFGFAFGRGNTLIVSEAFGGAPDASALSSYRPEEGGWQVVTASLGTTETAACWVITSLDGRFAYTTNTASNSISGYRTAEQGALQLLDPTGVTATTGAGPIDLGFSRGGQFLYTLNAGGTSISAFQFEADGQLTALGEIGGLPASANGLIAR